MPQVLDRMLAAHRRSGLFTEYPFGTDFSAEEIVLAKALKRLSARTSKPLAKAATVMRAALHPGTPAPLFRIPGHPAPRLSGSVSRPVISGITPDKQRFLFRLGTKQGLPSINVVLNWRQALEER